MKKLYLFMASLLAFGTAWAADFEPETGKLYRFNNTSTGYMPYDDPTISSTNLQGVDNKFDYRSLFRITKNADGDFLIQTAYRENAYVYAINTNSANANVGVKVIETPDAACKWTIGQSTAHDGTKWYIAPKGASVYWNKSNNTMGMWSGGNTPNANAATNAWEIIEFDEDYATLASNTVDNLTWPEEATTPGMCGTYGKAALQQAIREATTLAAIAEKVEAARTAIANAPRNMAVSGWYRVKNRNTQKWLFASSADYNPKNLTLANDGVSGMDVKYLWKVEMNGSNATVTGAQGKVRRGAQGQTYASCTVTESATIPLVAAGVENTFGWDVIHTSNQIIFSVGNAAYNTTTNPLFLTSWGPGVGQPGNQYVMEPVSAEEIGALGTCYTVNITAPAGVTGLLAVTYAGSANHSTGEAKVYSGGFYFLSATPSVEDFTATEVENYLYAITVEDNQINVVYRENGNMVKFGISGERAEALEVGQNYVIFNTAKNDSQDRTGYITQNGASGLNLVRRTAENTSSVTAEYVWTLEQSATDGKYYLKSKANDKYVGPAGKSDNASGVDMTIIKWETATGSKSDIQYSCNDDGSNTANADISADNRVWLIGNGEGTWWNGNTDSWVSYSDGHPYAFYKAEAQATKNETVKAEAMALLEAHNANKGKIGYPVDATYDALKEVAEVETFADDYFVAAQAAVDAFNNPSAINLPEDGKAYRLVNSNPLFADYGEKILAVVDGTVSLVDANAEENADLWVARKAGSEFVLVNGRTGGYMELRGNSSNGVYQGKSGGKGNTATYDNDGYNNVQIKLVGGNHLGYVQLSFLREGNDNRASIIRDKNGEFDIAGEGYISTARYNQGFKMEEVAYPATARVNAVSNITGIEGISTYSAPYPVVVPTGYQAWYVNKGITNDAVSLVEVNGAVPANEGVLLTGAAADAITLLPATTEAIATIEGNKLGNTAGAAKDLEYGKDYILTNGADGVAFYPISSSDLTVAANKAYLHTEGAAAPSLVLSFGDDTDAIKGIETVNGQNAPVYDLQGRRVQKAVKGLYIQGSKKFMVK